MNMFMLWSKHMREIIRSERPEIHHADLSKILGAKWNALPPEEKKEWQLKAEEHLIGTSINVTQLKSNDERSIPD